MIIIRSDRLEVETGTGTRSMSRAWYFDHEITNCWSALAGYRVGYVGDDHNVLTLSAGVTCAIRQTEFGRGAVVEASLLLRDDGGDAPIDGWVDYVLFVEFPDRPRPPIVLSPTARQP